MGTLRIHSTAGSDFESLYLEDRVAAKKVAVFIREAQTVPELLDTFTRHGHGKHHADQHEISKWHEQQRRGRNLWRVSIYDVDDLTREAYRIVYGFFSPSKHIILGIAKHDGKPTDFYDDENHPFTRRIIDVYDEIR